MRRTAQALGLGIFAVLVVARAEAAEISFGSRSDIPVGENPSAVATGDLNRDGNVDIVVTNHGSGDLTVLLGGGDGAFLAAAPSQMNAAAPSAVLVADFDNDRRLDLAVASDVDSTVTLLLGNGDGTFQERSTTGVGDGPEAITGADFDRDGTLDVATADTFGDSVSVALGNGNATLRPAVTLPIGHGPCGLAAGDLTDDGAADLLVSLGLEGLVAALINDGSGMFKTRCVGDCSADGRVTVDELVRGVNAALGTPATPCPAFDTNDDGLVTIDELVRGVNSALNGCTFDGFVAGEVPAGVAVGDFNGDGSADALVANEGSGFLSMLQGFGDGSFDTSQDFSVNEPGRALLAIDLDADGNAEMVTTQGLTDSVSVLPGNGDGTFGPAASFAVHEGPSAGLSCAGLAAGDFNGDGLPDLVTANDRSDDVTVLMNETILP